jgi:hypothetical protein
MKTFSTKVALSALAVAALLSSPALAAKRTHQVNQDYVNQDVANRQTYNGYGAYTTAPGTGVAGYDSEGGVVGIASPEQYR